MTRHQGITFDGVILAIIAGLLLQAVISSAGSVVKSQINYLSIGISAFIILTLLAYSLGTVCQAVNKREGQLYGLIILGVFLLSG